ncbi:hypothetical protein P8C59_005197 [Phyllachora maydis]|uniref:Allantoicase domain-containing protein n=1 Tax=Phyllachora maydis TaxID=1825666 RepID=A0AAD9I4C5_9PEZI|nr:hypothetical protein P8C59_005197 [Phyllachora maydis]
MIGKMEEAFAYQLPHVKATLVSFMEIDSTLRSGALDLVSAALGGKVLGFSDQWFAEASNLLRPTAPIRQPGKMVHTDSGRNDDEVLSWKGERGGWETLLGVQECGPSQRFGWRLDEPNGKPYTHVRLNMYPDGGIARFRLFGHAVPVFPDNAAAVLDLAAAQNGGIAVSCSDQHFGTKDNLLLPGRGEDMADGWETARSRTKGHVDWAIIRLGAPGCVQRFVADTAHFRGNYPQQVKIEATRWTAEGEPTADSRAWKEVVEPIVCGPDREHVAESLDRETAFTHVKLIMVPDGGVKRLRVFARRSI